MSKNQQFTAVTYLDDGGALTYRYDMNVSSPYALNYVTPRLASLTFLDNVEITIEDVNSHKEYTVTETRLNKDGVSWLTCDCYAFQRRQWCPHIVKVYREQLDARVPGHQSKLFDILPAVAVTVFTRPRLDLICTITEKNDTGMREVTTPAGVYEPHEIPIITDDSTTSLAPYFLGYISTGQGRYSLRNLLLEWLVENSNRTQTCTAKHHNLQVSRHFSGWDTSDKADMTKLAHLLTRGMCTRCVNSQGVPEP